MFNFITRYVVRRIFFGIFFVSSCFLVKLFLGNSIILNEKIRSSKTHQSLSHPLSFQNIYANKNCNSWKKKSVLSHMLPKIYDCRMMSLRPYLGHFSLFLELPGFSWKPQVLRFVCLIYLKKPLVYDFLLPLEDLTDSIVWLDNIFWIINILQPISFGVVLSLDFTFVFALTLPLGVGIRISMSLAAIFCFRALSIVRLFPGLFWFEFRAKREFIFNPEWTMPLPASLQNELRSAWWLFSAKDIVLT